MWAALLLIILNLFVSLAPNASGADSNREENWVARAVEFLRPQIEETKRQVWVFHGSTDPSSWIEPQHYIRNRLRAFTDASIGTRGERRLEAPGFHLAIDPKISRFFGPFQLMAPLPAQSRIWKMAVHETPAFPAEVLQEIQAEAGMTCDRPLYQAGLCHRLLDRALAQLQVSGVFYPYAAVPRPDVCDPGFERGGAFLWRGENSLLWNWRRAQVADYPPRYEAFRPEDPIHSFLRPLYFWQRPGEVAPEWRRWVRESLYQCAEQQLPANRGQASERGHRKLRRVE